jgi:hypothetical protein
MNPVRSLLAVLGGILLISLLVEPLEFTLVGAIAGGPVTDIEGYFAVRNRPGFLAAKVVYNTAAALLGGYMVAKIAGHAEMWHAGVAAALQTAALIWGATASEYAPFTPVWMWVVLTLLTGPAMLAGGAVRTRAGAGAADRVEERS